ncbi:helix-turn-helix domain-containing protein [Paenibacillus urinalis]|uniref:Helix-turn-helix domain-containing protein n=1 Tax=Paenibacillus urinalis TaxID=521520 RepID=A0ABY7XCZ8_9BACL|nr:helix-turn-helix domain-containing protein [Paenibacillus urinalis]WDH95465.1 helix-turn-helix domain-containing protein [Paenibacillus urinalis]WDI03663.1 helix-turn-helix domain-containing protein [Paenibacillus urinalis]
MSKRSLILYEVKLNAVKRCLRHESNPNHEAKQLGVRPNTVTDWIRKYQADGEEGLRSYKGWKSYSKELQLAAIQDVLLGEYSV